MALFGIGGDRPLFGKSDPGVTGVYERMFAPQEGGQAAQGVLARMFGGNNGEARPLFGPSDPGVTGVYESMGGGQESSQGLFQRLFGGEPQGGQMTVEDAELQAKIQRFRQLYGRDPKSFIELQIGNMQPTANKLMNGEF